MIPAGSQSTARGPADSRNTPRAGSRGGNVRDLDTARDLQAQVKDKRGWAGAIDEQIRLKLVGTATVHANDLDGLNVPPEHRNLLGTRMARYCNKGWMEPTVERRKVTHVAANGRKNPVYRITRKGWGALTAGADAELKRDHGVHGPRNPTLSVGPGEQTAQPSAGAPQPKGADRATSPPVPSASAEGSPATESPTHVPIAGEPSLALFELSPERPLNPLADAEAA